MGWCKRSSGLITSHYWVQVGSTGAMCRHCGEQSDDANSKAVAQINSVEAREADRAFWARVEQAL